MMHSDYISHDDEDDEIIDEFSDIEFDEDDEFSENSDTYNNVKNSKAEDYFIGGGIIILVIIILAIFTVYSFSNILF